MYLSVHGLRTPPIQCLPDRISRLSDVSEGTEAHQASQGATCQYSDTDEISAALTIHDTIVHKRVCMQVS